MRWHYCKLYCDTKELNYIWAIRGHDSLQGAHCLGIKRNLRKYRTVRCYGKKPQVGSGKIGGLCVYISRIEEF